VLLHRDFDPPPPSLAGGRRQEDERIVHYDTIILIVEMGSAWNRGQVRRPENLIESTEHEAYTLNAAGGGGECAGGAPPPRSRFDARGERKSLEFRVDGTGSGIQGVGLRCCGSRGSCSPLRAQLHALGEKLGPRMRDCWAGFRAESLEGSVQGSGFGGPCTC